MKYFYLLTIVLLFKFSNAQEFFPEYFDYLSDNLYVMHPASAGVGSTGKIRAFHRLQWLGVKDAPMLSSISFHNRFGSTSGVGAMFYNDKNGYSSQRGAYLTYAYHLNLSNSNRFFRQLSFAVSGGFLQKQLDQTSFDAPGDVLVTGGVVSSNFQSADFGMAYHQGGFYSYLTLKNVFVNGSEKEKKYDALAGLLKTSLLAGYFWGDDRKLQYEPSLMVLHDRFYNKLFADFNFKVYKNLQDAQLWLALSYRYATLLGGDNKTHYFTPVFGINYRRFMLSYNYTEVAQSSFRVSSSGFHQITLGFDVFVKRTRIDACPNINAAYLNH